MKKISFRHHVAAVFAGLAFSTNVLAAGEDIGKLMDYLQQVLNAAVQSVADSVYEFNKMLPKTVATNVGEPKTQAIADTYSRALAYCQVYNSLHRHSGLTDDPDVPEEFKSINPGNSGSPGKLSDFCRKLTLQIVSNKNPLASKENLSGFQASDSEKPKKVTTFVTQLVKGSGSPLSGNGSFSFENLISPALYSDETQQQNALRFASFAARSYEPLPIDPDTWRQVLEKYSDQPEFINYQMALRSYVAAQSVAVSNLYRMIAERTEQEDIKKLQLKNDAGVDIKSPLQYQEYLATHRANNQNWYTTMNSASINTVSRETVYILAEIQRSLYRMEQTNERLLATLSVMQLLNLNSNARPELKSLAPAVQSLITGKKEGLPPGI